MLLLMRLEAATRPLLVTAVCMRTTSLLPAAVVHAVWAEVASCCELPAPETLPCSAAKLPAFWVAAGGRRWKRAYEARQAGRLVPGR